MAHKLVSGAYCHSSVFVHKSEEACSTGFRNKWRISWVGSPLNNREFDTLKQAATAIDIAKRRFDTTTKGF